MNIHKCHRCAMWVAPGLQRVIEENARLRGLMMAAQDVLAGAVALTPDEHDAFLELIDLAIKDAAQYDRLLTEQKGETAA